MDTRNHMTDQLLDDAACDAIGANTSAESAAYAQQLAAAGEAARKTDRTLREAVSRLSAASPYMTPPSDLRGRILQATAPATFRMEDYRKAMKDNSRLYKWGFYAAMLFLMAGAWYNMDTRNQLTRANQQAQQRDQVIAAFVNPNGQQITWRDEAGHAVARAIVDVKSQKALVIGPQELFPPGYSAQLALNVEGKNTKFQTVLLTAPAKDLNLSVPSHTDLAKLFNVTNLSPDSSNQPRNAGF